MLPNPYKASGTIVAIVDGPGDREAVKCLLDTWLKLCGLVWRREVFIGGLATTDTVVKNVRRAMAFEPDVILLITDSEARCRSHTKGQGIGEALYKHKFSSGSRKTKKVHYGVVVANECFEAWLLAASPNFNQTADTRYSHKPIDDQTNPYKDELEQIYGRYSPITSQKELTDKINFIDEGQMKQMVKCSISFNKLIRVLEAALACPLVSKLDVKLRESSNPQVREISAF